MKNITKIKKLFRSKISGLIKRRSVQVISVLSLISIIFSISFAAIGPEWSSTGVTVGDTQIETAANNQQKTQIVADGTGGYVAVWAENNTTEGAYEVLIKSQKFDANGDSVWGSAVTIFSKAAESQWEEIPQFTITEDGSGGAYVVFRYTSFSPPTGGDLNVHVAHVTSAGALAFQNSSIVYSGVAAMYLHDAIYDGNGGVIFTLHALPVAGYWEIRAQRVDSSGQTQWGTVGNTSFSNATLLAYDQLGYEYMDDYSAGWPSLDFKKLAVVDTDYVMGAWAVRNTANNHRYIMAQKVQISTGTPQFGYGASQVVVDQTTTNGWRFAQIVPGGDGGAYIAWYEYGAGNINFTKIDGTGSLDATCSGVNGYQLAGYKGSATGIEYFKIISDNNGGMMLAYTYDVWGDNNTKVAYSSDCVDSTSAVISHQPVGAGGPEIISDGANGAYVSFSSDSVEYLQHIYIDTGVPTSQFGAGGAVDRPTISAQNYNFSARSFVAENTGTNGVVIAYAESSFDSDNYITRIDNPSLETANDESDAWTPTVKRVVPLALSDANDTDQQMVKTVDGSYVVAWLAKAGVYTQLWVEKFDTSGTPQWNLTSPVYSAQNSDTYYGFTYNMVANGNDVILSYAPMSGTNAGLFVTKLQSTGGTPAWSHEVATDGYILQQFRPQLVSDGGTSTYIIWHEKDGPEYFWSGDTNWRLYATKIDNSTGNVNASWNTGGSGTYRKLKVDSGTYDNCESRLITDDSGGFIITAQTNTNGGETCLWGGPSNDDIRATRIDSSGTPVYTEASVATVNPNKEFRHNTVSDGASGFITTYHDTTSGYLEATRIRNTGGLTWGPVHVSNSGDANTDVYPQIVSDGSAGAIISWINASGTPLAQNIDLNGTAQWTAGGASLTTSTKTTFDVEGYYNTSMISDGIGGAVVTWRQNDLGGDAGSIYAQNIDSTGNIVRSASETLVEDDGVDSSLDPIIMEGSEIISWISLTGPGNFDLFLQSMDEILYVPPTYDTIEIHHSNTERGPTEVGSGITNGDDLSAMTDRDFNNEYGFLVTRGTNAESYSFNGTTVTVDDTITPNYETGLTGTVDIPASGGDTLQNIDDAISEDIPLGFEVTIYDKTVDTVRVSSNGFVYLNSSTDISGTDTAPYGYSMTDYLNLPASVDGSATGDILIAGSWLDLDPSEAGTDSITYYRDAANEVFIITFDSVGYKNASGTSFQIKIKGNGDSSVICVPGAGETCATQTIGCNGAGSIGISAVSPTATFESRTTSFFEDSTDAPLDSPIYIEVTDNRGYDPDVTSCGSAMMISVQSDGLTSGAATLGVNLGAALTSGALSCSSTTCVPNDISVASVQGATGEISTGTDILTISEAFSGTIKLDMVTDDLQILRPAGPIDAGTYAGDITFTLY